MRRLGVDSVPIALFIAVFTGIVLSLLSSYIFTGTVPLYFVGALVGKTIMMELGPVLTGMALAGRVGASIAAELGTMKVTEQVDALETLATTGTPIWSCPESWPPPSCSRWSRPSPWGSVSRPGG
jgi:phospholipid/cholesterol/gamma-HCH transport system permease protein